MINLFLKRPYRYFAKQMTSQLKDVQFRNRPFIVICGCTGTGKTKLSIQLAEWLIKSGKKSEIINADAMQLYKNLDIITNKATSEEMKGIKHHLIGYLDSFCITNIVTDYKNKAVDLIDKLLQDDVIPILVGGTHYYMQSVIWDLLIEADSSLAGSTSNKHKLAEDETDSSIVKLILECTNESGKSSHEANENTNSSKDLNVRLHDSNISTEEIYRQLELVDKQSAQKIHPNDRRKLCRALQIYYSYGIKKSELLDLRNKQQGPGLPLRYKNVCLFMLNCQTETLNKRLDERVDQMITNGLLNEIEDFKIKFEKVHKGITFREYSRDFEFGIFQSIGFKEFEDFFNYVHSQKENEIDEIKKKQLFDKAVEEMKISTRRYAKTQVKWVKNRFVKRADANSPIVYELDTTDLDKWNENVFVKSSSIFENYLNEYEKDPNVELNKKDVANEPDEVFEYNKCDICDRIFVDKSQWICHMKGAKHKKRKESLRRKEAMKLKQEQLEKSQQTVA